MGRKRTTQKSLRRGLIEEIYNSAPMPQPAQPDYTPSFNSGMSRDEIANIYNSYTPETQEIPTLKPNTTPTTPSISDELERMKKAKADTTTPRTPGEQKAIDTYYDSLVKASGQTPTTSAPKTDYKAEIDRMNAIKADTSAPRTEGENRAIETYLNSLVDAQRYLDSQKPKTNTKKIGTVKVNADGTKTYTKAMSTEEKKNYEDEIRKQAIIERGKEIGKLSLDAAKAGKIKSGRALSANEQRDVERAIEAVNKGQAKAVGKWAKENAYDRGRALSPNEQRDLERAQKAIEKAKEKEQKAYTQTMEMADTYANNAPENSLAVKTISKNETPQPTPTAQNLVGAYADTLVQNGKEQEAVNFVNDVNNTLNQQYENQLNKSNIDDSKWLVKKADLDRMLQNEEFASDLDKLRQVEFENANQDATVSEEWAKEYGAKNITGGYSEDEYYKLLEDKYNLSKAQLSDIADTLQYYEREKERDTYARDLQMFGALNPKLGTLASYAGTAGNAIEGLWNTGLATISGDPRTQSHLFDTTKNELRHGVEHNFNSDFGKGAYQAIAGLGDLAVGAAYGNAPLILAGNTAGEATTGAIERGADVNRAGLTGLASGIADYAFNKVGLDKAKSLAMDKLTAEGAKQFIQQNLIAGGTEAAENVLQDLTETVIDYVINDKQSEIKTIYALKKAQGMTDDEALASTTWDYLKQLGVSAGTGFLMGSGMQAGTTAINNNIIPFLTGTPKGEIDSETLANINNDIQNTVAQRQAAFDAMNRLNGVQQRVNVGDIVNSDARIPEMSEPENPFAGQDWNGEMNTPEGEVVNEPEARPIDGTNEPLETNNIDSDDINYSKVYDTLAKNKIINMANQTSRINAQYNVHHMDDVLNEARNRYLKNADRWEQEFAEGSTEIRSDADVATAMFLLEDKRARIEALQKNGGDKNEIAKLVTERDILARRLRAAGTEKGQAIKAFDYFNGTADGAIINAQRMYDAQAKRWEKKNPNVAKKLEKVADSLGQTQKKQKMSSQLSQALANLGNDSLKAEGKKKKPKTREQIRSEVEATLMNEFSSVEDIFTTEDIDFITDMIESKIPVWQITDELQHRLEHGIWYDLEDEPKKLKKPKNSKLIGALNEITEMPESESDKVKPDFDMVRETVLNTLESEFGSIDGIFDDADIDYIANLINTGATTNELAAMLKTKMSTGMWDIPQETRDKVNDIFARAQQFNENSKERVELETQAFWELANCTKQKASLGDKFEAWRYLAMLGNPKTHIRNIIGNTLFSKVTGVANGLAALMEQRYDAKHFKKTGEHIQRTKAILTKADSDLVKASKEDAYKNAYRALTGDKWHDSRGVQDAIKKQRDIFDSDAVNKANRFNNNALSGEDTFAMINKYKTSLAGYLKANGLDTSIFEDEVRYRKMLKDLRGQRPSNAEKAEINRLSDRIALLQQARDYAVKQAEYSAFHEDNIVADTLSEFSRKLNTSESPFARGLGKMVEGVLPFKKTPANILRSGFEFSPLNIIQDAVRAVKLKRGTGTAAELFESMGKTLTGDMLTIMGAWLFSKGMLNIEDDDTKWQGDLEGRQNYSLVIPIGKDKYTFTVDSLAPSFMPIFLGAQAKKMWDSDIKNPPEEFWGYLSQALESGSQLISPIAETSMLSGVNDTLEALSTNGGLDALATLGLSTITGYASQGIPTLTGQIARTVDPVRRSTYTESNDPLGRTLEKKWQKIENKIPFVSMLNQPYIDAHGDMQYNFTDGKGIIPALGNALYQMASPFYIRKYEPSSGDIVTDRIYDETKDKGVFATNTPSKKIGDKRLTAEQRTEFDTIMGRTNEAIRTALGQNEDFNKMTPEMQKDIFKSLNSFSDAVAESYLNPDKESSNQLFKAYNSAPKYDERGFEAPGVQIQAVVDDIIASNNPYGLDKKTYNEMKDSGEDLTKYEGYAEARAEVGLDDSKGLREAWLDGGLDGVKEFAEYKNALSETGLSDSDTNKQAFSSNGIEGLQQVVDNKQKAIDLGFVNKDGTANVSKYDDVLEVMGDDAGVEKYKTISDDIGKKGYSSQADYVPYVLDMPLTTVEKGKILYLEGKPKANSSAEKAYDEYGYAGLAEFRQLQYLNKDYPSKNHPNGDGKIDTYDRIQQLYEWGYNDKTDEFKFYINSGLSYSK